MISIQRGLSFSALFALAALSAAQPVFAEEAAVEPASDAANASEPVSPDAPPAVISDEKRVPEEQRVSEEKSTVEAPPAGGKPGDGKTSTATSDVFVPSEDISEDLAVSLPVDI